MATFVQGTGQVYAPSPSTPIPIQVVTGRNDINVCGKNRLDVSKISTSASNVGIALNSNGEVYDTSPTGDSRSWSYANANWYLKLEAGTYTLSSIFSTKCTDNSGALIVFDTSNTRIGGDYHNINNVDDITINFTLTTETTIGIMMKIYNGVAKLQLEKGSTKTDYEAYTGYTQEINLGKNLFDKDNANTIAGYIDIESVIRSYATNYLIYLKVQSNTTYTLKKNVYTSGGITIGYTQATPTMGASVTNRTSFANTNIATFTTPNDINYLVAFIYNDNDNNARKTLQQILDGIQLEKGSQGSSYSAYKTPIELCKIENQDHTIKYQDRIFFNEPSSPYYNNELQDYKWFLHKEIGKGILKGNESYLFKSSTYQGSFYVASDNPQFKDKVIPFSQLYCNYFSRANISSSSEIATNYLQGTCFIENIRGTIDFRYDDGTATLAQFKTWLNTHNIIIYYPLATSTDTEITDEELLEQLNNLMNNPLLKGFNYITNDTANLYPNLNIEYYRDTTLNENFVSKEDMTKYYTKVETNAQIQLNNASIQQSVSELQETTNGNTGAITTISNQINTLQTSTSLQINSINEQIEDGVPKVKTTTGYTLDGNGLSITKGQGFSSLTTDRYQKIEYNNKELSFMGYDDTLNKPIARIEELEARKITTGVHRTETIQEDGEYWTAQYYVGGGN